MNRAPEVLDRANGRGFAVAIVADEGSLRRRLAQALEAEGVKVAVGASKPEPVLARSAEHSKVLVVLGCDPAVAPAAIQTLRRGASETRVVFVADEGLSGRALRAAVRAQADAVVYSDQIEQALVPSLRAVAAEQVVFPRRDRRRLEVPALSHRERQVLRLAAQGRTNDEIAKRLYLANSTVKSHLTSAFAKLAVGSRSEAAAVLFDPDEPVGRAIFAEPLSDVEPLQRT